MAGSPKHIRCICIHHIIVNYIKISGIDKQANTSPEGCSPSGGGGPHGGRDISLSPPDALREGEGHAAWAGMMLRRLARALTEPEVLKALLRLLAALVGLVGVLYHSGCGGGRP